MTADVSERSGRWSRRANRVVSAWRAIGGRLVVEGGILRFEPHGMERALGEAAWSISTAEIEAVSVAPVRISHFLSGGLRRRLRVDAQGDTTYFVVNDVGTVVDELRARVH